MTLITDESNAEQYVFGFDEVIIGQYTGELDKNVVKIFENDVVILPDYKGIIIYDTGKYIFQELEPYVDYEPYQTDLCNIMAEIPNDIEVIGTTHEESK